VREEIELIRQGKHGARSTKQAIAIGLSKARRAGVNLPPPKPGSVPEATRRKAKQELEKGGARRAPNPNRSRAATRALKRETGAAASERALSAHARAAARQRTDSQRSSAAKRAARTRSRSW
jgi:hypothetical protein